MMTIRKQFDLGETDPEWANATRVLVWIPGCFHKGGGPGGWEFQPRYAYEARRFLDYQDSPDLPEDADPALLAAWVASKLGYPVTLLPAEEEVRRAVLGVVPFGRRHIVPCWVVLPAEV